MAGHRRQRGRPRRQPPGSRARERLSSAVTAEDQLAAAYDLFRMSVRRAQGQERPRLMRRASEFLTGLAAEIHGSA